MNRRMQKREPKDWLWEYEARVADVFGFLVTEYGFGPPFGPRSIGYAIYLEFTRPPVAVEIELEVGGLPEMWVNYINGMKWVRHGLSSLSRETLRAHYADLPRGWISPQRPEYLENVGRTLVIHADLLRTYGQPFLRGDPSQLEGVRPGQFNTTARPRVPKK